MVKNLDSLIAKIENGIVFDNAIRNFLSKALPAFLDGSKSAEQTAKELNDEVNLYLNE